MKSRLAPRTPWIWPRITGTWNGQQASVPLAFRRLCQANVARDAADWLARFNFGLRGGSYDVSADLRDRLAWSAGLIEGGAQQVRPLEGEEVGRRQGRSWRQAAVSPGFVGPRDTGREWADPPRQPVDLAATTKEAKIRSWPIWSRSPQQRDPILADRRAAWLDIALSVVELESAVSF